MSYLAYVDESGTPGLTGSSTYALGCVLVKDADWPEVHDALIRYRRFLRQQFGLPIRAELKANYLTQNGGPFKKLKVSEKSRARIYRLTLRLQSKLPVLVFAILVDKKRIKTAKDPREVSWEYLLQRLERFTTKGPNSDGAQTQVTLVHDEGEAATIRKLFRKARRAGTAGSAFGTGYLKVPGRLLLDDPTPRDSRHSYFLQLADLDAYAAYRRVIPPPARPVQMCPTNSWDALGAAIYKPASELKGKYPGLVIWPS
jgi:uncharacterized protein DUF3800